MKKITLGLMVFAVILLAACGPSSPVENLKEDLNRYPQYSIILEDMKQEGNIFKDYFHRYKIVYAEKVDNSDSLVFLDNITDWLEVKEKEYQKYQDYLGMAIASKTPDGEVTEAKYPPGYQYVGNPRYGQWRQDSHGNSFWEFYGKYAFISSMFSLFSRPVYMNDWDTYRDYRQTGRPYYGRNQRYGTNGTFTKKTHQSFFERRRTRERLKKQSFMDRIKKRARRSRMSGVRSRSGGWGK